VTRIIDPLASRCSKFRFKSLDQGNAKKRVEEIAEKEGVKLEDGATDALIKCGEGDLRKAITFLQSAARLMGAVGLKDKEDDDAMDVDDKDGKIVTVKSVEDIAGVIPDATIEQLVKAMQPRSKGLVYEAVAKVVTDMVADGWSATQVVTQVRPFHISHFTYANEYSYTNPSSITSRSQMFKRTKSPYSSPSQTSVLWMVRMSISRFSICR
jgi:replication factor C subunit 2/4